MAKKKVTKKATTKSKKKAKATTKPTRKANTQAIRTTKRKLVKPSKPKPSSIHHVHLPEQLLKQIAAIYESLGPYLDTTLEQFENGFLQDMHPVREIANWTKIKTAWRTYHQKFLKDKIQSTGDERRLVSALVAIATGIADSLTLGVPADVARKLLDCFAHANDLDSKPKKKKGR